MGGKSSGGSNGTTTVSTTQPPASVLAAYNNVVGQAQNVAGQPLQQYQGPLVAGFNPTQTQAMNAISGNLGTAQPYINSAAQEFGQATTPLWQGVQQFSPGAVGQYESPYTQQVVNATQAQFNNQNAQAQQGLIGNAISSGAWGGDRASVAQGVLAGQQQLAQAPVIANLENQGYSQALGEFNQQQQSQLGANQANAWLDSQAAFGLGQLGQEAQNTTAAAAQQELGVGGLQQQLQQEQLNVPYEQFLQQQAYPFQTTNWLAGITEGIGGNQGGSSTTTTPGPSTASELTGLGIAGLGAYGQATSGQSKGKSTGGAVRRRADGGSLSLPGVPDVSISYVPSTTGGGGGGRGMGPPQPPSNAAAAAANANTSSSQMGGIGSLLGKTAGQSATGTGSAGGLLGKGAGSTAADIGSTSAAGVDAADAGVAAETGGSFGADALSAALAVAKRGGPIRRAGGGGVTHDNTWLSTAGGVIGSLAGAYFGGPLGAMGGNQVGKSAGQGLGDLFAGNWSGLEADVQPPSLPIPGGAGLLNQGGVAHRAVGGSFTAPNGVSIPLLGGTAGNVTPIDPALLGNFSAPHPAVAPRPVASVATPAAGTGVVPTAPSGTGVGSLDDATMQWLQDTGGNRGNARGGVIARHADGNEVVPNDTSSSSLLGSVNDTPSASITGSGVVPASGAAAAPAAGGLDTKTLRETIANQHVDPWMSVIQAGLAIAGGNSPHTLQNIAQGAQSGLANYSQQRQTAVANADKEFDAEAKAKQLADTAANWQSERSQQKAELAERVANDQAVQAHNAAALAQTGQHQTAQEALERQRLGLEAVPPDVRTAQWLATATPEQKAAYQNFQLTKQGLPTGIVNPAAGGNTGALNDQGLNADYFATLPAATQATVKSMVEGRMAPPTSFAMSKPYWQTMMQIANTYDPNFDQTTWSTRNKTRADFEGGGKSSQNVTAINTALGHAGVVADALDKLGNSDFPTWNAAANWIKTETGSAAPTNARETVDALASEGRKVFAGTGGGNLTELENWQKNFPINGSPDQQKGALRQFVGLLDSRLEALGDQYNRGMQKSQDPIYLLSPEAQASYVALTGRQPRTQPLTNTGGQRPTQTATSAPALPPAALSSLQEGHITTFGNGQKWTLDSGQPKQVQ